MRFRLAAAALCAILFAAVAHAAFPIHFGSFASGSAPTIRITGVTPTSVSYTTPAAPGFTLATMVAAVSSGSFTGSYSLNAGDAGCADLLVNAGTGALTVGATPLTTSVTCTVFATQGSAVNSPFMQLVTITASPPTIESVAPTTVAYTSPASPGSFLATMTATLSFGSFTGTWSLSADAGCSDLAIGSGTGALTVGASPLSSNVTCHVIATQPGATGSPFSQLVTITGTAQSIVSASLSNNSFVAGAGPGSIVGVASAGMSPTSPPFAGTWSVTGTNAADFTFSGTNLETVGTLCGSPPCSYSINIVATQAGATGSPFPQAETITANAAGVIALTRTFNQPTATTTPAKAFWQIGQPFKVGEVPTGNILTATLAGTPVRVRSCNEANGPLLHADGSWRWARLLVDYSGQTISPGSGASLAFSSTSGSWGTTSTRSNADWEALNDTVTLNNLVTSAPSGTGYDQPSGTWTATFNGGGTNTIVPICANDLGIQVEVKATFVNGATTQVALVAVMDYWVTENSDGTLGPIASKGPFVEDMQAFKTNFSNYTYDLAYLRNGTPVRSMLGVQQAGMTSMVLPRIDGQWDWTANDPSTVVTQDYTLVRATKTIPPIATGITFTGGNTSFSVYANAPITVVSAGLFSTNYPADTDLAALGFELEPTAIDFTGSLGGLSGLSLNTTYWTCLIGAGQFKIYDTFSHATAAQVYDPISSTFACSGTTGQVIPTGSYSSGLIAELSVAPTQGSTFDWGMSSPGSRPEISWPSEQGVDYLVGNTQKWQRQARVQAYTMWGIPQWVLNDATGCIPSLMDATGTPTTGKNCVGGTGLGTAKPTTAWTDAQDYSSDINGGNGPIGANIACSGGSCTITGTGPIVNGPIWGQRFPNGGTADVNGEHWPGAMSYIIWLLEGDHYLQDQVVQSGNRGISNGFITPGRRIIQVGGVGTTYYGSILTYCYSNNRGCAWAERDAGNALYAAPEGSAEQAYFRNEQNSNAAAWLAYTACENSKDLNHNFTALGFISNDDTGCTASYGPGFVPFYHSFFQDFIMQSIGMAAVMDGEFITNLPNIADNSMAIRNEQYNTLCPFFGDVYNVGVFAAASGSWPPTYIPSISDIGSDLNEGVFSFSGTTVTSSAPFQAPYDDGTVFNYAVGDKYRALNSDANGDSPITSPPSPLVLGTDYYIVGTPTSTTFQISATPGGAPITFATNVSGAGGIIVLTASQTCPPTGSYWSNAGAPDSYLMQNIAALGVGASRGTTGSSAAYSAATARAVPSLPAICATEAMWCMGPTF